MKARKPLFVRNFRIPLWKTKREPLSQIIKNLNYELYPDRWLYSISETKQINVQVNGKIVGDHFYVHIKEIP